LYYKSFYAVILHKEHLSSYKPITMYLELVNIMPIVRIYFTSFLQSKYSCLSEYVFGQQELSGYKTEVEENNFNLVWIC